MRCITYVSKTAVLIVMGNTSLRNKEGFLVSLFLLKYTAARLLSWDFQFHILFYVKTLSQM